MRQSDDHTRTRNPATIRKSAPRPRTKPAETRRDELLAAAAALFVAKGVGPTTIDEIAARADVAKGTVYIYFPSKDDLVAALRERFVAGFRARIRAAIEARPAADWSGRLESCVRAGIDAYLDDHPLHDVVFHDHRPDQRRMKSDNPVLADIAGLLEAGARAGAWTVDDPALAAIVVFQGMHAAADKAIDDGVRDGAGLAEKLSTLFLGMLQAR